MKKTVSVLIAVTAVVTLCSCSNQALVNMTTAENGDYTAIVWEDRTYVPYCAISKHDCGQQIGIVNGDKDDRVWEYKGHSANEWIINAYAMDSAMLCKERTVTDIPEGLQSEYAWNN